MTYNESFIAFVPIHTYVDKKFAVLFFISLKKPTKLLIYTQKWVITILCCYFRNVSGLTLWLIVNKINADIAPIKEFLNTKKSRFQPCISMTYTFSCLPEHSIGLPRFPLKPTPCFLVACAHYSHKSYFDSWMKHRMKCTNMALNWIRNISLLPYCWRMFIVIFIVYLFLFFRFSSYSLHHPLSSPWKLLKITSRQSGEQRYLK